MVTAGHLSLNITFLQWCILSDGTHGIILNIWCQITVSSYWIHKQQTNQLLSDNVLFMLSFTCLLDNPLAFNQCVVVNLLHLHVAQRVIASYKEGRLDSISQFFQSFQHRNFNRSKQQKPARGQKLGSRQSTARVSGVKGKLYKIYNIDLVEYCKTKTCIQF